MPGSIDKYRFPKAMDEQFRFLALPLDEAIPLWSVFLTGIAVKEILVGTVVAGLLWAAINWVKRGRGSQWLYNMAYWHLPTWLFRIVYRVLPDSRFRYWIR